MVVSESPSKDRRRSSVSPIRERVRRKPRQDWLVAVGQGHSPARTLTRESRGRRNSKSPRTKKFDSARLSFGGLEQDLKPRRSQSPSPATTGDGAAPSSPSVLATPPHSRPGKKRPSLSPSSAASSKRHTPNATSTVAAAGDNNVVSATPTSAASSGERLHLQTPQTDDTTAGLSGSPLGSSGGGGSPFRRRLALEPTSSPPPSASSTAAAGNGPRPDWLSAAVARRAGRVGRDSNSSHVGGEGEAGAADAPRTTSDNNGAEGYTGDAAGLAAEGGGGRDAKLSSLLLLSPGKEYWAGRLAAHDRRDSESPRAAPSGRSKSRLTNTAPGEEVSGSPSPSRGAGASSSPARATEPKEETASGGKKKDYFSFTAGKRGAPLSPSGSTASSSVWSTQAFTSPGVGGGASLGGGGKGRVDLSPWRSLSLQKGEAWPPSSPSSSSLSPVRLGQRRRGLSPNGARVGSAAAVAAHLQAARRDGGAFSSSLSPAGGGRPDGFRTASSARFSPGKGSLGLGFGGRSRSASPPRTKVPQDELHSRLVSPTPSGRSNSSAGRRVARGRFTSPSSLPVVEAGTSGGGDGAVEDTDCPERTTAVPLSSSKSDSPERTGEDIASDDGGGIGETAALAPSNLFQDDEGGGQSAGVDFYGGTTRLEIKDLEEAQEETLLSPVEAGAGAKDLLSPAARPSPLRPHLYSPFAQEPSPCTGHGHHLDSFAVAEDDGDPGNASAAGTTVAAMTSVAEDSRPPLHGNGTGFRGHAPPGVRIVATTPTAGATATPTSPASSSAAPGVSCSAGGSGGGKSREHSVGSSDGGRGAAVPPPPRSSHGEGRSRGEAKLRVCTPTGDGGTSDLSLWVTLRNLEEEEGGKAAEGRGARPFSSLSPVTTGHVKDSVGGERFSSSSTSGEQVILSVSSGGVAENESRDVEDKDWGAKEGGDDTVGALSSEDTQSGVDEELSDTTPLLAASGRNADQDHTTSGGKGAATGTSTRVAVASASTAAQKAGQGEGSSSSVDWCDVGPRPEDAGGVEGWWRSLSQAFCGLLNFCHPHQGGRGGANWCR